MRVLLSLLVLTVLVACVLIGVGILELRILFGVVLPYSAIAVFIAGFVHKILDWARSPVPFRIPTTCGQQKSLDWIKANRFDNPHSTFGVVVRMALEILFFRSLFRNTRSELLQGGSNRLVFGPTKWLWAFGLAFHWSLLLILIRHLRFFMEPTPAIALLVQNLDGFFQVGIPVLYSTSLVFVTAGILLFCRRVTSPQLRYISFVNDYFPLFLLISIGATGLLLRHVVKTDVVQIKEFVMGLVTFQPTVLEVHYLFYIHLFLVTVLLAYFPFSKLMHMGGIFLSPTRNLANNNRKVRHINPWDYPVHVHTYREYEKEFRSKMVAAGIPVEEESNG